MSEHKTLAAALIAARKNMKDPRMTGKNAAFKKPDGKPSKFVPRDQALDAVMDALLSEGIMLVQAPCSDENGVGVETTLLFGAESLTFPRFTVHPAKNDPQGAMAATTYASRGAIMLIFGLAGDEDDDGNTASQKPKAADPDSQAGLKKEFDRFYAAWMKCDPKVGKEVKAKLGNPATKPDVEAAYTALSDNDRGLLMARVTAKEE